MDADSNNNNSRTSHRNKTEEEIQILKECIDECNKLRNRSPQKRLLWTEYSKKLREKGYDYSPEDVRVYYNNRKDDDKKKSGQQTATVQTPVTMPPSPQTPIQHPIQQLPPPSIPPPQQQLESPFIANLSPPSSITSFSIPMSISPFSMSIPQLPPPPSPSPPPPPPLALPPIQTITDSSSISSTTHRSILKQDRSNNTTTQEQNEKPTNEQHINFSIPDINNPSNSQQITDDNSPYSSTIIAPTFSETSSDQLLNGISSVPKISDELSIDKFDTLKYELYQCLQNYRGTIWRSYSYYKNKDDPPLTDDQINESLLHIQEIIEERFVKVTKIFTDKLIIHQIYSHDNDCENLIPPKVNRTISRNTRIYNKEEISPLSSASNSCEIRPFPSELASSADKYIKEEEQDSNDKTPIQPFFRKNIFESRNFDDKLVSFYVGEFNSKTEFSLKILNVETSIIISYHNDDNSDFVCDFAFVDFNPNSHVLHFRDSCCETGFFLPTKTMYFHRFEEEKINKIYICGDQRIKEFQINGIDSSDPIEIINTNTFYFGESFYFSSVITIWEDELVFGCDSTLYFWDLKDDENNVKVRTKLKIKENITKAKSTGIDMEKIDWKEGKLYKEGEITIDTMERITSLAVVKSKKYLAVSSDNYPVIYLYNKEHQNVFRLISHTMGILSLKGYSKSLISGSKDLTAKLWDIENCRTRINFDIGNQAVNVVECGAFMNKVFLVTGCEKGSVIVWSISDKKALFEISLENGFVPDKVALISAKNKERGNFGKLMIISFKNSDANKICKIQSFDF